MLKKPTDFRLEAPLGDCNKAPGESSSPGGLEPATFACYVAAYAGRLVAVRLGRGPAAPAVAVEAV